MTEQIRKNVSLTEAQNTMLYREAIRQKRTVPYLIREAIDMYCQKKGLAALLDAAPEHGNGGTQC
jgi:hypothetical protein